MFVIPKILVTISVLEVLENRVEVVQFRLEWTCHLCAPKHAMHKYAMSRVISSFWHLFLISPW